MNVSYLTQKSVLKGSVPFTKRRNNIDSRFQYVTRGCAEFVEWLGQKENPNGNGWAAGADYGKKIITILNAIIGVTVEAPKTPDPEPSKTLYRVQVGAFGNKDYAERLKSELQGKGYDAFIAYVGGYYKVQIGAYSVKANAEAAVSGMKAAGYEAIIATATEETPAPVAPKKSIEELAKEVINGKWGNNPERKAKLTAAGYDYNAVQAKVNALQAKVNALLKK